MATPASVYRNPAKSWLAIRSPSSQDRPPVDGLAVHGGVRVEDVEQHRTLPEVNGWRPCDLTVRCGDLELPPVDRQRDIGQPDEHAPGIPYLSLELDALDLLRER